MKSWIDDRFRDRDRDGWTVRTSMSMEEEDVNNQYVMRTNVMDRLFSLKGNANSGRIQVCILFGGEYEVSM